MSTAEDKRRIEQALAICEEVEALTAETVEDWLSDALEVETKAVYSCGEWFLDSVSVVVTYGGPSIRVIWQDSDILTVDVQDQAGRHATHATSAVLADVLREEAQVRLGRK